MAYIFDSFYGLGYRRSERQPQDVRMRTRRDTNSVNSRHFSGTRFETVHADNLCTADKYVETVIERLRSEMRRLGIGTAELHNMETGPQWELRKKGTITGMDKVSPYGSACPVAVLPGNIEGGPMEVHYDVSAMILMEGIKFEAEYGYISPAQMVKGKVSGSLDNVLLYMIIGHPQEPDIVPELHELVVTVHSGMRLSDNNIGVLDERKLRNTAQEALGACIEKTISSRMAPVLNEVLKGIAYPTFTDSVH